MSALTDELDENGRAFREKWASDIVNNIATLSENAKFTESYRRVAALQAIRAYLIKPLYSADATAFFVEAQNDALTSHVLASFGAWRSALKALRSSIENVYGALYFRDHPVEFRLWEKGTFRLGFSSAHRYFCEHPDLACIKDGLNGLEILKSEYATLSKAVHGSAKSFRMTKDASGLLLWSIDLPKLGSWSTRHRKVVEGLCLMTVCMHADRLKGAANPQLRAILGQAIGPDPRNQLRSQLHVHIDPF